LFAACALGEERTVPRTRLRPLTIAYICAKRARSRVRALFGVRARLRGTKGSHVGAGIFVVHTPEQARDAGALVDLLESALALSDGAVACSSLPGYAWALSGQPNTAEWDAMLQRVGAAVAIADNAALANAQWMFDIAAAFGRGLWTVVLLDDATQASRLPVQLTSATLALRGDERSVQAVMEDLAFELGLAPRMGQETKDALSTFSSIPPAIAAGPAPANTPREAAARAYDTPTRPPPSRRERDSAFREEPFASPLGARVASVDDAVDFDSYEALETVPPPASSHAPREMQSEPPPFASHEELFELDSSELQPIDGGMVLVSRVPGATPVLAFEAGRSISECSFHRNSGGDFVRELEGTFGAFIDAVGGDWRALSRIGDVEVWLGATDNLLDSLPPPSHAVAEWYELGYQLSTLHSIAEHGGFDDPQQRETYEDLWGQAMRQLRQSAQRLRVRGTTLDTVQWQLENLVGPYGERDYRNVAATLDALREQAFAAEGRRTLADDQLARFG
jgi:hypothetical protein